VGLLFLLPEVRGPRFADFWAARRRLRLYYSLHVEGAITQGGLHAEDAEVATDVAMGLAESVVVLRATRASAPSDAVVADTCLRALGCREGDVADVARRGRALASRLAVSGSGQSISREPPADLHAAGQRA